jgi:hypothetical protein
VQESQLPAEEQEVMMRNLERKETEYMRLQRRKIGIDDFEQLTVIGKGAFGEKLASVTKGKNRDGDDLDDDGAGNEASSRGDDGTKRITEGSDESSSNGIEEF